MYTADDERFWSYRAGGNGSLWTLRDLNGKVLRDYQAHLAGRSTATTLTATERSSPPSPPRRQEAESATTISTTWEPAPDHRRHGRPVHGHLPHYYPYGQEIAGTYTTVYTDTLRFTGHERDLGEHLGAGG